MFPRFLDTNMKLGAKYGCCLKKNLVVNLKSSFALYRSYKDRYKMIVEWCIDVWVVDE